MIQLMIDYWPDEAVTQLNTEPEMTGSEVENAEVAAALETKRGNAESMMMMIIIIIIIKSPINNDAIITREPLPSRWAIQMTSGGQSGSRAPSTTELSI